MTPTQAPSQTAVFRAIADPTRRRILELLMEEPRSVQALCEPFDVSQPAISQHMRVLREAQLVEASIEWRHRIYQVTPEPLQEVLGWVRHFEQLWDGALERLAQRVEEPGAADARNQ